MKKRMKVIVDCGEIIALVVDKPTKKSFPIKKGKFKIKLTVPNCWRGSTTNYDFLDIKEDSFIALSDAWPLDEEGTEFIDAENIHKKGCIVSTGGDGAFFVNIEITPVKKITHNPYKELLSEAKNFFKGKKFSDELAEEYANKFMHNIYSSKLDNIVRKKRNQQTKRMLKQMTNFLKKHNL